MWHVLCVHRNTSSFPVKCPASSHTSRPLFLLSRRQIPEGPLTFERCVEIAAPEVTVTVTLLVGGWEGLALWFRTQEKKIHLRPSGFAYICKKSAIFHLRQDLILRFPPFGKAPLKRSHFSKAPVFILVLNISYEAFDCRTKAIHPFGFSFWCLFGRSDLTRGPNTLSSHPCCCMTEG